MDDLFIMKGQGPVFGLVYKLVYEYEITRFDIFPERANGGGGQDMGHADLLHGQRALCRSDGELRRVNEIRRIEAAFRRIDVGNYGVCHDCDEDIGYERLKSQPFAERCVTCQTHYEKSYAHEGRPTL